MAPRSKVDQLPPDIKQWLDDELTRRGFSGYETLSALLFELGFVISHASVHRYGQKLERKLNAIKASTEAAQLIARAAPDSADDRSSAVAAMIQVGLFDSIMDLQDAEDMPPEDKIIVLSKASQGFAKLFTANLLQKKWADDLNKKLEALEAQARRGTGPKRLDEDTLKAVREAIYSR